MKLKNLNALITGGSQGLGKAIAEQFLREGANVVLCARSEKELSATRAELAAAFPSQRVLAKTCDVASESRVNELVAFALAELGSLDALVLNAGIYGPMGPTETVDLAEWRRALDINLFGVLLPCRAVIPHFKKAARGKIVVLSGGGATNPLPNISAYAASKAAVVRLMETLAEELRPHHVDVNAIAPGALATRLVDEVLAAGPDKVGAAFFEKNKMWKEKGAVPLELGASLAVYLASAESDGITGKLISAQWDPWRDLQRHREELAKSDIYCLRRIVPEDRGKNWSADKI
jgi:3-oxoacyl-[acyl-carrier protein] reductase